MSLTFAEIVDIVNRRRRADSMLKQAMIDVRDRYNGEWVMPLPDVASEPTTPITIAFLVAEAIDGPALRAASVTPQIMCPPVDQSKMKGIRSWEWAEVRRRALGATWYASQHGNVLRRYYRHLSGYAQGCLMVVPDFDREMPRVVVRDPLTAYPEPRDPTEVRPPRNVAFVYGRSPDFIHSQFPDMSELLMKAPPGIELWDLVEWIDEDEVVYGILGPRRANERTFGTDKVLALSLNRELGRMANRLGYVPGVVPHRVTLDKVVSQIANQVGNIDLMARMQSLEIMAQERAIYPDAYAIGMPNGVPDIVGGRWKDGREGDINLLTNVREVGLLRADTTPMTAQMIDRQERNFRVSTGLVPTQGGETYGSLRTGRGIDSMQDVAVEPRIKELQEITEYAMAELNTAIFDTYKAYWPGKKYQLLSGWAGSRGLVEFVPSQHFENTLNMVSYPIPGADVNQTTVGLGQMVGADLMSHMTGMEKHPYVDDAAEEHRRINVEKLEQALQMSVLQRATQGGIPPADLARILKGARAGDDLADVILEVDEAAQQRQASQPPPPSGQAIAPGTQPGLANPGEGAEAAPNPLQQQALAQQQASVPPPTPGQQDIHQLIRAVVSPGRAG